MNETMKTLAIGLLVVLLIYCMWINTTHALNIAKLKHSLVMAGYAEFKRCPCGQEIFMIKDDYTGKFHAVK